MRREPPFHKPVQRPSVIVKPHQRPARRYFRWYLLLVPLAFLFLLWVARSIHPAFSWSQVMDFLRVKNRFLFTHLAILGCILVAIIAVIRILHGPPKNDD